MQAPLSERAGDLEAGYHPAMVTIPGAEPIRLNDLDAACVDTEWQTAYMDEPWYHEAMANQHPQLNQTRVWRNASQAERAHWQKIRPNVYRYFPVSPFVPRVFGAWLKLRAQDLDAKAELLRRKIAAQEIDHAMTLAGLGVPQGAFMVRVPSENANVPRFPTHYGAVLAQPTIWTGNAFHLARDLMGLEYDDNVQPYPAAHWPSWKELKWEGEDRAKSNVGRFLPLPREHGNATVAWHHCHYQQPLPFDEVRRVPDYEDIHYPPEDLSEEDVIHALGEDLMWAIHDAREM